MKAYRLDLHRHRDCPGNLQFCVGGTCYATESNNGDDSSTLDWTSASDTLGSVGFKRRPNVRL